MAKAIVGLIDQPQMNETGRAMQAPQSLNDKHGPKYDNDVASTWVRGMGPDGACGKPGFDHGKKGR